MEQVNRDKSPLLASLFLLFLILWSGGGFTYGLFPKWMIYCLPFIGSVYLLKGYKITKASLVLFVFICIVFISQLIIFRGTFSTIIRPIFEVACCLLFAPLIIRSFSSSFVTIVRIICVFSLVFWLIDISPSGHQAIVNASLSIPQLGWDNLREVSTTADGVNSVYIYSTLKYIPGNLVRNSGPFWEPGRFTIFITFALAINLFSLKKGLLDKSSILFIITNITTFSTAGYLAMLLLIFTFVMSSNIGRAIKVLILIIMAAIIPFIMQLDFMSEKLIEQSSQVDITYSRFGAMYYHWTQIIQSPIIGFGPFLGLSLKDLAVSPNGITDLLRFFGIPLSLFMFFTLFRSYIIVSDKASILVKLGVFASILMLCFAQTITHSPFFYLLYFLGLESLDQSFLEVSDNSNS